MANKAPYKCKTRSRPFRLPVNNYQKAVDTVNASLKSFKPDIEEEEAQAAENILQDAIIRLKSNTFTK